MDDFNKRLAALPREKQKEVLERLRQKALAKKRAEPEDTGLRRRERNGLIPASSSQARLWFIHELDSEGMDYRVPIILRIDGALDVDALAAAVQILVERHEVLRTVLVAPLGSPMQQILDEMHPSQWGFVEVSDSSESLAMQVELAARQPFDLSGRPPFYVRLFQGAPEQFVLLLMFHHVIVDEWSAALVLNELEALYKAQHEGCEPELSPPTIPFADFASWESERLQSNEYQVALQWWIDALDGVPTKLQWPVFNEAAAEEWHPVRSHAATVSADVVEAVAELGRAHALTLTATLFVSFATYLARITSAKEMVVAVPMTARDRAQLSRTVGFLVNTVPIPIKTPLQSSFSEILALARDRWHGAIAHGWVPYHEIVQSMRSRGGAKYEVLFNSNHQETKRTTFGKLPCDPVVVASEATMEPLHVSFERTKNGIECEFAFDAERFDDWFCDAVAEGFPQFLSALVGPGAVPADLVPYGDEVRRRIQNSRRRSLPKGLELDAIRAALGGVVPDAWLPDQVVVLSGIPRDEFGNVRRAELPAPDFCLTKDGGLGIRTPTEDKIAQVWARHLGRRDVDVHQSFFDAGGHSLMAAKIQHDIEQTFGHRLTLGEMLRNPTIAGMAAILDQQRDSESAGDGDEGLVTVLRNEGDGVPVVLVHGVDGTIYSFLPVLSELPVDSPVLGLSAPGVFGDEALADDVETIARNYAEQLAGQLPAGRCKLIGWSFGGVLAMEVGRALEARGIGVEGVLLLDAFAPDEFRRLTPDEQPSFAGFVRDLALQFGQSAMRAADLEHTVSEEIEEQEQSEVASRLLGAADIGADLPAALLRRLFATFTLHLRAYHAYQPQLFEFPVTLVIATANRDDAWSSPAPDRGWKSYLRQPAKLRRFDVDHYGVLRPDVFRAVVEDF